LVDKQMNYDEYLEDAALQKSIAEMYK